MLLLLHLKNSLVLCYTLHNHCYPKTSQPSTTSSMDDRTQCNGLDIGNDVGNLILLTVVRKSERNERQLIVTTPLPKQILR